MTTRLNTFIASPQAMNVLLQQEEYLKQHLKEIPAIWELIKLRVSQINQCAYCIDMHAKDALHQGVTVERIYGLSAWRDMVCYSKVERCALQWTEIITSGEPVSTDSYQRALATFGEKGLVDLTIAINAINAWNRLSKAFKPEVGTYQVT